MLRGIRDASSGKFGKAIMSVLFGVLIVSFGLWGIGDIFKGYGQSSLASIGKTEISTEQFRTLYTDKLQQIGRQIGRPMTPDQARRFGLDRQVLQQIIAEAALDEEARRLGLAQSDAAIVREISADPNFAGADGKFDPQRFAYALRQFGYTEQRYVAEQRRTTLRRQIAGSFTAGIAPSKTQLDALTRYQNEERTIEYIQLGPDQAGKIDPPTAEQLQSYFDERKGLFRAPEYRKIAVLTVTPEEIGKKITVSDEDARKIFERDKDKYAKPERREIKQIAFPTLEAAKAAREKIAGGTSFEDLAKEMKLTDSDTDLGLVTQASVGDPAIAAAAFAAPLNEVSQPVKGALATALIKVTKIEPGTAANYDAIAPEIKKQIATDRARGEFQDIRNKVEDERGGGANVAEAAKKLGLDAITIEAVDRSGRAPDGQMVKGLPSGVDVLTPAFASGVGVETDPINFDGGELWFDVLGITPSRDRTLDEVKDQVTTRWHDEQVTSRLRAKGGEIVEKLNKGEAFAAAAAALKMGVKTTSPFKRTATVNGLSERVVETAFRTPKDSAGQSEGASGNQWVVFKVTGITVPPVDPDSEDARKLKTAITNAMTDEQVASYIAHLEDEIGVTINQAAFATATGASTNQ